MPWLTLICFTILITTEQLIQETAVIGEQMIPMINYGSVNVMNAGWGTMQERGNVALNLTESHKTVKNISECLIGKID